MSSLVNCFKFWCYVREKGDKRDKPDYKEMKEIKKQEKTEKKALEMEISETDVLYEIEI
tara:strand:+ start:5065 stop:5241 length:177 start_codon:yes stop_codon:yes gene_type:complete